MDSHSVAFEDLEIGSLFESEIIPGVLLIKFEESILTVPDIEIAMDIKTRKKYTKVCEHPVYLVKAKIEWERKTGGKINKEESQSKECLGTVNRNDFLERRQETLIEQLTEYKDTVDNLNEEIERLEDELRYEKQKTNHIGEWALCICIAVILAVLMFGN